MTFRLTRAPAPPIIAVTVHVDEPANFQRRSSSRCGKRFWREHRREADFHQRQRAFSLTRNGHLLSYYQPVSAPVIGVGEMRWKPTPAGGRETPHRFTVRRSPIDAAMLQIVDGHGPGSEMTLAGVVDTIVRMFKEQTAAHG